MKWRRRIKHSTRKGPDVLITAGTIASKSKHTPGRVQAAIKSLKVTPAAVAGRTRVFDAVDESRIVAECDVMKSQRRKREARRGK